MSRKKAGKSGELEADALNAQAWEIRFTDRKRALALAEEAERAATAASYAAGLALSLHRQGWCCLHLSDYASAQERFRRGIAVSREAGELRTEANCLICLGTSFFSLSDYPTALDCYLRARELWHTLGDLKGEADAWDGVGAVQNHSSDYQGALASHQEALTLRERLPEKDGMGLTLQNIGCSHADLKHYPEACRYYERALALHRPSDTGLRAGCLANLSAAYSDMGQDARALAVGCEAVCVSRGSGNRRDECWALVCLGTAHRKAHDIAGSLPWYHEALAIARSIGDRKDECQALNALGASHLEAGDLAEAYDGFWGASEIAAALKNSALLSEAFLGLSEVYEKRGAAVEALDCYKKFRTLEKEVYNEAADRRGKALMIQMQVERVQQEAELHRLKNVELAEANRKLQEQSELLQQQAEEMQAQSDELERQAMQDGLTGLANRRCLEGWLAGHLSDAVRDGSALTVAMADVDHFKQINDQFGHEIGDHVLRRVGRILRQACREGDLAARYGGEEFVLALPGIRAAQGYAVCERLRRAVERHAWEDIAPGLAVTLSLGLSDDLTALNHERLLRRADEQLYQAKRTGRNRVCGHERDRQVHQNRPG